MKNKQHIIVYMMNPKDSNVYRKAICLFRMSKSRSDDTLLTADFNLRTRNNEISKKNKTIL